MPRKPKETILNYNPGLSFDAILERKRGERSLLEIMPIPHMAAPPGDSCLWCGDPVAECAHEPGWNDGPQGPEDEGYLPPP